jgi:hypothetical protein
MLMIPTLIQAEQTLWTAVEILATSPDLPEERLRSAWLRVQQVVPSDLPERLLPAYQALHDQFQQHLAPESGPSGLPLSRLAYLELSTALCAFFRRMQEATSPRDGAGQHAHP